MIANTSNLESELSVLRRIHRGKVRDTYEIPAEFQPSTGNLRLVVATDRISIFDFVLNATVKDKGAILTAMNIFWRRKLSAMRHDLFASGASIDAFLPESLRGNSELQKRAVVVQSLLMIPVECIARGYLTGSGWSAYKKGGFVCGHPLPPGLHDGSLLEKPIFTPTTKAEVGHDEHMDFKVVQSRYPDLYLERDTLDIYSEAQAIALEKGVIIADTKFEFGMRGDDLILADEILTPDSSRFWDVDEYAAAQKEKKSPTPHDKQFVREYGKEIGIADLSPEDDEDREWVRQQVIPQDILDRTTEIYRGIFERLTGSTLARFQRDSMGIVG